MTVQSSYLTGSPESKPPRGFDRAVAQGLASFLSPDLDARRVGLDQLLSIGAHLRSSAVASVLTRSLREPDVGLRAEIAAALAQVLAAPGEGEESHTEVRVCIWNDLSRLCACDLRCLLEVTVSDAIMMESICGLLNGISGAGELLCAILLDQREECQVRLAAAEAIGHVGFLEALPSLERFCERLSAGRLGQLGMPFAPRSDPEAERLLPVVGEALVMLQEAAE